VQLHRERHRLDEVGVDLVIIGNGTANFIAGFRERSGYEGVIYTDPERAAYKALGLRRGVRSTFSPGAVKNAVKAYRQGFRQIGTQGDALQQGGVFVVAPSGDSLYSYRSQRPGDHPPIDDLVAAVHAASEPSN
jgi:hypothetical protein